MEKDKANGAEEPLYAPGLNTHDALEDPRTDMPVDKRDTTDVTMLYLDRTPDA